MMFAFSYGNFIGQANEAVTSAHMPCAAAGEQTTVQKLVMGQHHNIDNMVSVVLVICM